MPSVLSLDAFDLGEDVVRERFASAVRLGHPRWLWPDMRTEDWQAAVAQIEVVTRQMLIAGRAQHKLCGRAAEFGIAGYTSGMGPLLGYWQRHGLVEACANVGPVLDLHYRHNVLRMEAMTRWASELVERLAARDVRVTVLKGMETAFSVFPEPGTRPLSDIDLLIDPEDSAAAGEVLREAGFRAGHVVRYPPAQNWRRPDSPAMPRSLAFVHADDPWSVDLQTSLDRRYSFGSPVLALDGLKSPAMLEPWSLSPAGRTLASEALVVHLACHASCGLQSLSLLRLVELVLTIRADQQWSRFSWDRFVVIAEQARASAMVYPALRLAERLVPGTVRADVLRLCRSRAPKPVRRVVDRLEPHSAQKMLRCSLEERFMWTSSPVSWLVQVARELFPPGTPLPELGSIYRMRAWRLLRGTVTR